MDSTQNKLLALVRIALGAARAGDDAVTGLSSSEWEQVYRLAARQGVLAIAWDAVQMLDPESQPPRELKIRWAMNTEKITQYYARQQRLIAKLAAFYRSYGIRMMILKGYGLSLCYPTPEHRACGDVDIWLYGRQAEADDLLHRELGVAIDQDKHHHTTFSLDGILVENHYDFLNVHAHASNRDIERLLQAEAQGEGTEIECGGEATWLPTPDFNALFLLRHAASHFAAREIGLRHVVDWMVFILRYHAQVDWEKLERTAREMNMHRFLYCMNAMAITLGADEKMIPPFQRDKALEERVLRDILAPEFGEPLPGSNVIGVVWFKARRWWANRWKHRIVYREGLLPTFVRSSWSHLLKPKSIRSLR